VKPRKPKRPSRVAMAYAAVWLEGAVEDNHLDRITMARLRAVAKWLRAVEVAAREYLQEDALTAKAARTKVLAALERKP
jgi:hypothetical protein